MICFFSSITLNSLAIPDTFCSTDPDSGYQCPEGMKCMKLELDRYIMGFNGFDEFGNSNYKSFVWQQVFNRFFKFIYLMFYFSNKYFYCIPSCLTRRLGIHYVSSH